MRLQASHKQEASMQLHGIAGCWPAAAHLHGGCCKVQRHQRMGGKEKVKDAGCLIQLWHIV